MANSFGHSIEKLKRKGDFGETHKLSWYTHGCTPYGGVKTIERCRLTDEKGAERFAKKWGL